jgi:2-keto-4-pentenoate hydratase/2-oxohepta-3-ene-1,7-dioic acid hydratase in catechol pathway
MSEAIASDHVAGLTVGRDISERSRQLLGPAPQFSLGKSSAGFSPIRPSLVMPDELADP